jgi:hypothetical protein
MNIQKRFFGLLMLAAMFATSGCVKDDFDTPDNNGCLDEGLTANITIADLKSRYISGNLKITDTLIIQGVVISSDQNGNFYKELVIQDATGGILLLIDQTNMYTDYPVGRQVYVNVLNLYMSNYGGVIQVGASINPDDNSLERIPQSLLTDIIKKGACNQNVTPLEITASQLDPVIHQSTLIKLVSVKMADNDAGVSWATVGGSSARNRTIADCNNGALIARTSDFAKFAGSLTPTERFNITGVYSVFNSDKQFKFRSLDDIEVTPSATCPCIEIIGPVNGTTRFHIDDIRIFDSSQDLLLEGFTSTSGTINLAGWKNITQIGNLPWVSNSGGGQVYAKISVYNTGQPEVATWLITPAITVSGNSETLTFTTQDAYDDGAALEVLVSTDYDGGNNPENFTWTKLCPTIAGGDANGFGASFVPSGNVDISGFTGTTYVAWRYKGQN